MNLKNFVILAVMLSVISGCKSTPKIRNIALDLPANHQTFTFKKLQGEAEKVTTVSSVHSTIRNHVKKYSGYAHCNAGSFFGSNFGKCTKNYTADVTKFWGQNVNVATESIDITYFRGEKLSGSSGDYRTEVSASLPYKLTETDKAIKVDLFPATQAVETKGSDAILIPISSLVSDEKLQTLLSNVMTADKPSITSNITRTGKFDVNFEPASVQTNFERKFDKRAKSSNSQESRTYENTFDITVDNLDASASIKIFLYRGKSQVEYSISHPVTVSADGSSSYSTATMDKLVKLLQEVAHS